MSAGYDAEVAELFRDLRSASNLSEADLAAQIATPVEVVQALEQGAIYALPPWPETARIVNAYGALLKLDTRPLLRRIYAQIEAGVVELGPKPVTDVPVMQPQPSGADKGLGAAPAWTPTQPGVRPRPAPPPLPQASPGQPAWQNGPIPAARPQAPNWPGGPQQFPQAGVPGAQGRPQPQPTQGAPARVNEPPAPPQRPAPDPAAYQQPPQAYPPGAPPLQGEDASFMAEDASMGAEAAMAGDAILDTDAATSDAAFGGAPEAEPKRKRPALLKWGIIALIASVVLVALWMALGDSSDSSSSSGTFASDPVLDPDDPRSRKADRLPSNF